MSQNVKFYLADQEFTSFDAIEKSIGETPPLFFLIFNPQTQGEQVAELITFLDQREYLHLSSPIFKEPSPYSKAIDLLVKLSDVPSWNTLFHLFDRKLKEFQKIKHHGVETYTFEGLCEKWHIEIESPFLKATFKRLIEEADVKSNLQLRKDVWDHLKQIGELLKPIVLATEPIVHLHPDLTPICQLAHAMDNLMNKNLVLEKKYPHLLTLSDHFKLHLIPVADSKDPLRKILQ